MKEILLEKIKVEADLYLHKKPVCDADMAAKGCLITLAAIMKRMVEDNRLTDKHIRTLASTEYPVAEAYAEWEGPGQSLLTSAEDTVYRAANRNNREQIAYIDEDYTQYTVGDKRKFVLYRKKIKEEA